MSEWLIFLAIVPLSCMHLTRSMQIRYHFMWSGIAGGLVIAPVSFGLIQMSYIPYIGQLAWLVGVILNLTHGSIGYVSLLWGGLIEPNTPITATELVMINVFNGVLFAYIYGLIGYAMDRKMARANQRVSALTPTLNASTSK